MNEPFLGMIGLFAFNFAPRGWAICDGRLMSIVQNEALFSLIGTTYGGDGVHTFALPNLQGRVPLGYGQGAGLSNYDMGQASGTETVTLTIADMPAHNHMLGVSAADATTSDPGGNVLAIPSGELSSGEGSVAVKAYAPTPSNVANPMAITVSGNSLPHNNMQPYLGMNYCIALVGIYPSQG